MQSIRKLYYGYVIANIHAHLLHNIAQNQYFLSVDIYILGKHLVSLQYIIDHLYLYQFSALK